jgi:predicted RecA/RadA family phage recombinase
MNARFIHDGKAIDYIPTVDAPAGSVIVTGDRVGITKFDIAANTLGALAMFGVFDFEKDNTVIPLYAKVYWNNTTKKATLTATSNTLMGIALGATVATDTIVRVRLN